MKNLDPIYSAICLENYVSIIGIILLVPVFAPEEEKEIDEIVVSKPVSQLKVYAYRVIISLVSIFFLLGAFMLILKYNNCEFSFIKYMFGTFLTAMFLGSIGLIFSAISTSTIFGYMVSIGYLILNMMTKNKYVGNFYIMSMRYGSFDEKYWLLIGSIVLILSAVTLRYLKRKMR